ncbi:MAG TPA: hypothetical protein VMG30_14135 [Acidobacteriota bacterium]|nr:hypothetical protein [Acidobacteriota bacterium]
MKINSERGVALIGTLLVLLLLGILLEAFVVLQNSDQKLTGIDREQNRAFYGSLAGLEKLTADLGTLFDNNYAPTVAQINALTGAPPVISGISYISPDGTSGYRISFPTNAQGKPQATQRTIPSGPYEGLVGLITPYTMTSTARTPGSAEVRVQRSLQTVAVPVFQFGVFSDTDLSFFAGPDFNFGGRVHTNGDLYLAEGPGNTLSLSERVTAVKNVIRTNLSNGYSTSSAYNGTVRATTAPGAYRSLAQNEGSLVGNVGSANNEPTWTNLSIGTYNGNIRNGRTGARQMVLPLVSMGASPIDLIRRPVANENADNPNVFDQRYFSQASLRILLSDTQAAITSLPTVTATAPVLLEGPAPDGTTYYAAAGGSANYKSTQGTPLISGYIKIEMQDQSAIWHDVTNEILALGIAGHDLTSTGSVCADQANAVLRFQRFMDSPGSCTDTNGQKYWPNVLYDTREGILRDNIDTSQYTVYLGGVMHYVELDINNLARWFRGVIGTSGTQAMNVTGYTVYFSDRRTNHDAANNETGEYGFEDFVNSGNITSGLPDGKLESAEDVNANGTLDTYGETPILPAGAASPLDNTARPWTTVSSAIARVNKPLFFRRALKLVNGQDINIGNVGGVRYGLAVASENPVYIQGNYNAQDTFGNTHAACSIVADAVTFLSKTWGDDKSFNCPHSLASTCNGTKAGRVATTTWYRTALIAGKGKSFPYLSGLYQDYGTDGGVHNFIRFLENWGGQTLNYRGSVISLFYNRQAVGTYKCCNNVYSPPTRGYNFDVEFLDPSLLPPRTPMFRDVNITGFTRLNMPNQ